MRKTIQIAVVLLLIGLTGCATTRFRFTSEPPGATVFLWRNECKKWEPKGTTPCMVVVRSINGAPLTALVSLNTNQNQVVTLKPENPFASYAIVLGCCGGSLASGAAVALAGANMDLLIGMASCVWIVGGGAYIYDSRHHKPEKIIHVDFTTPDQQPHPDPSTRSDGSVNSFADAMNNIEATAIRRGDRVHFTIAPGAPTVTFDGTNSVCALFEAQDTPNLPLNIVLYSYPKRIGSLLTLGRLVLVKPRVLILDQTGQVLGEAHAHCGLTGNERFLKYETACQTKIPSSGKCYILILPDSRVLGESVGEFPVTLGLGGLSGVSQSVYATSNGAMAIELR